MNCPSCKLEIRRIDPDGPRRGLFGTEFACPRCREWLKADQRSSTVKGVGGLIALVGVVLFEAGWDLPFEYTSWWVFIVMGGAVMLYGRTLTKLEVAE